MPPTISATGPLSLPFARCAELVASSATFQTLVGAADASEALELAEYPYLDIESDGFTPPRVLICDSDDLPQSKNRLTEQSGELCLQFFLPVDPDLTDPRDQLLDLRNTLGAILDEMLANARNPNGLGGTYFGMIGWRKEQTPCLAAPERLGIEFLFASFIVEWN